MTVEIITPNPPHLLRGETLQLESVFKMLRNAGIERLLPGEHRLLNDGKAKRVEVVGFEDRLGDVKGRLTVTDKSGTDSINYLLGEEEIIEFKPVIQLVVGIDVKSFLIGNYVGVGDSRGFLVVHLLMHTFNPNRFE